VRPATIAAGLLVCAAAAMAVAALASRGGEEEAAPVARATATPTADAAAVRDGKALWVEHGCGSCHTFAPAGARGLMAPNLSSTLKGVPDSYIRESIVEPDKVAASGFSTGMMPTDYSSRMTPAELDALVEFISAGVPD
jgi:mono/diheme cytochrome c family protein